MNGVRARRASVRGCGRIIPTWEALGVTQGRRPGEHRVLGVITYRGMRLLRTAQSLTRCVKRSSFLSRFFSAKKFFFFM